jgi:lambda family phage tail tape measure protein
MSIISRLSVVLGLDTAEFNQGIGKAEQGVNKFSGMAAGMKAGVIAAGAAFVAASYKAIEFADAMDEMATAFDISTESVIEMSKALSVSGGNIDGVSRILTTLTNKIDEAAQGSQKTRDAFAELGISVKDIGRLTQEELIEKTVKGLAELDDPIRRKALSFDLLGKSVKNVDIKAFNQELKNFKGTAEGAGASAAKIAGSLDRLEKLSFELKLHLSENLADPFDQATLAAERFFNFMKSHREQTVKEGKELRQSIINDMTPDEIPNWWKGIFGPTFKKELEQAEKQVNVFSEKMQEKIIPSINGNGLKGDPKQDVRDIKVSDEQKKVLDKITAQKTALSQNLITISRQTKEIGTTKLLYDDILQQFEKGGRYDEIKDKALKKRILDLAREYDISKLTYDADTRRGEAMLAFYEQGKEIQRQVIERNREQVISADLQVKEIENLTRRAEYEREIANLSDTQRQKALEYYDLKTKIVQMGQDPLWTDEQISRIETANQKMIEATDQTRRYENSFSVGFNRAFENFKQQATDSFSAGQSSFMTMTSNMESALDRFVQTGKISFSELAQSIIADLLKMQIRAQATSIFGSIFENIAGSIGGLFGGGGGVPMNTPSFDSYYNMPRFADGGSPPVGRASIVGERGPELFIPRTAGTIIPNNQLSSAMGGQPQTVYNGPVIQNMNAIDTQSGIQFLTKNKDTIWAANQSAQRALPMSR